MSSELSPIEINEQDRPEGSSVVSSKSSTPDVHYKPKITDLPFLLPPLSKYSHSPVDLHLTKLIGISLNARGYKPTQEFVDVLSDLALGYLHESIENIKKFTEIQRRTKPSLNDVRYSFSLRNIDNNKLYLEALRSTKTYQLEKSKIDNISLQVQQNIDTLNQLTFEESSEPFFTNQNYEITNLVPRLVKKPNYIPSYFPDLPPDYTFQNTASYMNTLSDMEQLRVKLVEESRMTEKSLYGLMEDDHQDFQNESEDTDLESVMSLIDHQRSEIETPSPRFEEQKPPELPEYAEDEEEMMMRLQQEKSRHESADKPFDVVAYAKKRFNARKSRDLDLESRRSKRQKNVFMQAETYYSPYAANEITTEKTKFFNAIVDKELENAIKAIKTEKKKQQAQIEQMIAAKAEADKAREAKGETIEFGFNFDNHSDSDSDNEDLEVVFGESGPNFDGPEPEPTFESNGTGQREGNTASPVVSTGSFASPAPEAVPVPEATEAPVPEATEAPAPVAPAAPAAMETDPAAPAPETTPALETVPAPKFTIKLNPPSQSPSSDQPQPIEELSDISDED